MSSIFLPGRGTFVSEDRFNKMQNKNRTLRRQIATLLLELDDVKKDLRTVTNELVNRENRRRNNAEIKT